MLEKDFLILHYHFQFSLKFTGLVFLSFFVKKDQFNNKNYYPL